MNILHRSFRPKVSLRLLLNLFLVTQIVIIAGLVAYISFRNGQAAVNSVAAQLRDSLSDRIEQHLFTVLELPHLLNQNNANLIRTGAIDPNSVRSLQSYFLDQIELYPSITSIYFGNTHGGIAGSGREGADGSLYVYSTPEFKAGMFEKFSLGDKPGQKMLAQVPNFDARSRVWYLNATQHKTAVWNDIYVLITGQDMAIAASAPVYDDAGNLIGVSSVDIFLSHLSNYLRTLDENKKGESFIIERSGLLVASSTHDPLCTDVNSDGKLERLNVLQSKTPVLQKAAEALITEFGAFENIHDREMLDFDMEGERQFLQVSPLRDQYGIDWLIVVISPESAFMAQIQKNNQWTLTIILVAVIASLLLSSWVAHKILRPISMLVESMDALKNKEWDGAVAGHTRIYEINTLSLAFYQMRETLRQTMQRLSDEIHERKQAEILMRESEDRYRTLVDNIPMGVFRIGTTGKIIAANPSFYKIFKLKPGSPTSQIQARDLFANQKDAGPFIEDLVSKGSLSSVEIQFLRNDGTCFWGSIIVQSVVDKNGEVVYFDGTIQDVTEEKKAVETLQYLVTHDVLTSISNRAYFEDQLSQAINMASRRKTGLVVLFLDLDDFKTVNDTFGHLKGDQLLQLVAQRISSCVRVSDVVARFGGDEFAVFLDGLSRDVNIRPIVEKIIAALSNPFFLDGREVFITASIGISVFPDDGTDIDTLIQNADHAMYRAKMQGKNSYGFSAQHDKKQGSQ